ncbi:MAG: TnpV protein [Lachnospiraceae bacterium]|nr:TnpV protein [Lachnospiraceae bacterium]
MKYAEWQKLSQEEKLTVPAADYPQLQTTELHNGVTSAKVEKKDGQIGWLLTQEVGAMKQEKWFPEITTETLKSGTETIEQPYLLNPLDGLYTPMIEYNEPSLEEQPIGIFGKMWMENMEKNYPEKVEMMMFFHRYLTVARSVDKRAEEYYDQLSEQYNRNNPRPQNSSEEIATWETMKKYEIEHLIMTEVVLVPVTTP